MTSRTQTALGVIASLIVFPFLIVYAQSIDQTEVPAEAEEQVIEQLEEVVEEAALVVEETTETPEVPPVVEEVAEETPAPGGEVLGESDEVVEETPVETVEETPTPAASGESASTTPEITQTIDTEATSTPPVVEAPPVEEKFVLQPAVKFKVSGNSASAAIELQNLTCKSCEKVLPDLQVIAYYTEWYPNDGPAKSYDQANKHMEERQIQVEGLGNWAKSDMNWSAENIPSGHYYFVVEVDPANEQDAYRLFRSEFSI